MILNEGRLAESDQFSEKASRSAWLRRPVPDFQSSRPRQADMAKRRRTALTQQELGSICGDDAFKFLVKEQGCSPAILETAIARYANACLQLQELRAGLKAAGISYRQLDRKAADAKDLSGFLARLQENARLVLANQMPYPDILSLLA
jgi:hypothetical protein